MSDFIVRHCGGRLLGPTLLLAAVLSVTATATVYADPLRGHHPEARDERHNKVHRSTIKNQESKHRLLSMSEAIAIAERRNNGEVLSARQTVNAAGEPVYIIKVVTKKGVVRKMRINARQ